MEVIKPSSSQSSQTIVLPLFLYYCEELTSIAKTHGIYLTPHNSRGVEKFQSLSIEQQFTILDALKSYIGQLQSAIKEEIDLTGGDNRKHAWWSLHRLGFRPSKDLFDQIAEKDIIEIYNCESIQVFRSFEMLKFLSYSCSEIFSYEWTELYSHNEFTFKKIFGMVKSILIGKVQGPISTNFPPHVVVEKFSEKKCWAKMRHTLLAPLYSANGSVVGYISTFRAIDHGP